MKLAKHFVWAVLSSRTLLHINCDLELKRFSFWQNAARKRHARKERQAIQRLTRFNCRGCARRAEREVHLQLCLGIFSQVLLILSSGLSVSSVDLTCDRPHPIQNPKSWNSGKCILKSKMPFSPPRKMPLESQLNGPKTPKTCIEMPQNGTFRTI